MKASAMRAFPAQVSGVPSPVYADRLAWRSTRSQKLQPELFHRTANEPREWDTTTFFERLHATVLALVLPCTVLWWPVYSTESLGTLTLLDCTLLTLWITSLGLFLGSQSHRPLLARRCALVCVWGVLIGGCYAIGTVAFGQTANLGRDFLRFLKIFGIPSIIPLSVCLSSRVRRIEGILTVSALLSVVFNACVALTGFQDQLPLFSHFSELSVSQMFRPTGAVSNPNDYGYISIAGLGFALAWRCAAKRRRSPVRAICFLTIVASLYGVVASGSRSAMVGIFGGAIYYVMSRHGSVAAKAGFSAGVLLLVFSGWQLSEVFRDRMETVLAQKTEEVNFVGRLEAQKIALRAWIAWPLGVGSSNMPEATAPHASDSQWVASVQGSDSIYVDTLLGAGIQGLGCLLLCLRRCWKLAAASATMRNGVLRAAILSMFCIGFASVAPATSFVAPFFFMLVGLAALPEPARKDGPV